MLMDSWRKRMTNGDTINLEELKMGLGLGLGLDTVDREDVSMSEEEEEEEEEEEVGEGGSSVFEEEVDGEDGQQDMPSPEADQVPEPSNGSDMFQLKLQPSQPALRETNGNKSPSKSPRKVAFSASIPNTPSQLEVENANASEIDLVEVEKASHLSPQPPQSDQRAPRSASRDDRTPRHVRCDRLADKIITMASKVTFFSSSPSSFLYDVSTDPFIIDTSNDIGQTKKRLSSPHAHAEERSPKLTVHDKLRVVQAQAETAALKGASESPARKMAGEGEVGEAKRTRRASRSPVKTRVGGRPKRRKSTLTPEELENLLMG